MFPVFSVLNFLVPLSIFEYIATDFPALSAFIFIFPSFFEFLSTVDADVNFEYIPAEASLFTIISELAPKFVMSEFSP